MFGLGGEKKKFRKLVAAMSLRRHFDDDILSAARKQELDALLEEADHTSIVRGITDTFQKRYEKIAPPYRHRKIRELLDLVLVVGAVAFGIRALYFQPFRIPTSSMQPTLYGIHYMDRETATNPLLGKLPGPLNWLLFSATGARAEVQQPGTLDPESLTHNKGFLSESTSFTIGGKRYTLPGDPRKVIDYARLDPNHTYQKGEKIADGFMSLGDHLFVERFSIYLTPIRRGDVMVFTTDGLRAYDRNLSDQSGFYYIKRLVGLPGDTLKIVDNQLYIRPAGEKEFKKAQDLSEAFGKVYSGKGGYQGHLNYMGEILSTPGSEYTVPADSYFMMGDNSRFSLDSRFFGAVPRRNLIGRAWVVFWPFTRRWGMIDRQGPVDTPTGEPGQSTFPVMSRQ